MRLRFTRRATERYTAALAYLTEQNPAAALRIFDKAQPALDRLRTFPMLGGFAHEYQHLAIRQIIVEPYRFFYFIDQRHATVWVVDVWHVAQIPDQPQLPAP